MTNDRFSKAHAYGNDFPLRRARRRRAGVALDALARELCDRHTGIGADGLILYEPTPTARRCRCSTPTAAVRGVGQRRPRPGRADAARR
jgi:diaminopimelate epimerase